MDSAHRHSNHTYDDVTKAFKSQTKIHQNALSSVVEGYLAGDVWKESQNLRDLSKRLRRFNKNDQKKLQPLIAKVDVALELCKLKQQHNLEDSAIQTINKGLSGITSFAKGKVKLENDFKLASLQRQLDHTNTQSSLIQSKPEHSINSLQDDFSEKDDEVDDSFSHSLSISQLLPNYFETPYSDGGKALPSLAKLRRAYNDACLDLLKKTYGTDLVRKAMIDTLPLTDRRSLGAGKTLLSSENFQALAKTLNEYQTNIHAIADYLSEDTFPTECLPSDELDSARAALPLIKDCAIRRNKKTDLSSPQVVLDKPYYVDSLYQHVASLEKIFAINYDTIVNPKKYFKSSSFPLLDPEPNHKELLDRIHQLGGPDLVHRFLTQKLSLKERNALVNQLSDLSSPIN